MSKKFLWIFVVTAVVGGAVWFGRPDSGSGNDQNYNPDVGAVGSLLAEEQEYDFGSISMAAGKVRHEFKFRNAGVGPVTLGKVYTSCMCTTVALSFDGRRFGPYGMPGHGSIPEINEIIRPGGEAVVEAVFDPAAHGPAGLGPVRRTIVIESDAGSALELGIAALVTP